MSNDTQQSAHSPDLTSPAGTPDAPTEAARRSFNMRGFTSLLLTLSFMVMVFSGVMLFLTPRGRVANWTDWTLLGLGKHQWGAVHIVNSLCFVGVAALHLYLNWSLFVSYLKKRAVAGLHMKRELAVATVVCVLLLVGTIASVPPFSSIMALQEDIKDYWEVRTAQAPVAHAEELTLSEFSDQIDLPLDELMGTLRKEGFAADSGELTVGELGRQKGVAPNAVFVAIQKHHPGAGAGKGPGWGRGRGQGRGAGGGGRTQGDSSCEGGEAAANEPCSDDVASSQDPNSPAGAGFGQGRGRGEGRGPGMGRGIGMGRGMNRGMGAGRGLAAGQHNDAAEAAETSEAPSTEAPAPLKGRTIIEQGQLLRVEGALQQNGHEWQLVTEHETYDLHLGPEEYRQSQGVMLQEGEQATVSGLAVGKDVAVCSLTTSGKTSVFRDDDGRPAWSGGGRGRNRATQ
jgi:hypothetical protein